MATIAALKTELCLRHDLSAYQQCLQHQVLREMEKEVFKNGQQNFIHVDKQSSFNRNI